MSAPARARLGRPSRIDHGREYWLRLLVVAGANVPTVLDYGLHTHPFSHLSLIWMQIALLSVYVLWLLVPIVRTRTKAERSRRFDWVTRIELIVAVVGILGEGIVGVGGVSAGVLLLSRALRGYLHIAEGTKAPGLVFIGSFVALIGVGTGLLMLPAATPEDRPIGFVDAMFTITSAISQTGLVVRPTGEGFTRFGQITILICIEVGALGVLVFGALLASLMGSGLGLRATQTLAEGTEQGWAGQLSVRRLAGFIIIFTIGVELIGAAVFYAGWPGGWGGEPVEFATRLDRAYHSVFFSVSSVCNAGFSTTSNSMEGLALHWTTHFVMVPLIVLGSIGFHVLADLLRVGWSRVRKVRTAGGALVRVSLNTKLILAMTLVVYLIGAAGIFIGEIAQTDRSLTLAVADAHFMSINRTAGFDTVSPADMGLLSRLLLIALMFIGGSPGSVAGGVKLMVVAVLALTVWATIRGRSETVVFGRTISNEVIRKCTCLMVLCLMTVMVATGVLAATEDRPLAELIFNTTSAFGTTGLSVGDVGELGVPSKIALTVAMLTGRVGPLAMLGALFASAGVRRPRVSYPTGEVVVY